MIKSDLLKEAIADANAVRETALANAKIALEEAFTPRIQSMLSAKLAEELAEEEEEEMDMAAAMGDEGEMDMEMDMEAPASVGVGVDMDGDGSYDIEGELGAEEEMTDEMPAEEEMPEEDELDLESIIRELEGMDDETNEVPTEEMPVEGRGKSKAKMAEEEMPAEEDALEEDIDSIIEAILSEEEEEEEEDEEENEMEETKAELAEAYSTINKLRSVLQEVNLLNAKLLYTNKLFRNFELNETQKMKVIDNFDRAINTREVKLVFTTLAESFKRPAKKQVVKENKSFASKTAGTTKPSKEIITEGNELVERMKKLAGLL